MVGEGDAAPNSEPARLPRALAIIFFGPLVGGLAAFGLMMGMNTGSPIPADEMVQAVFTLLLISMTVGWVTGLPAAAISALAWHFAEPRLSGWPRIFAAPAIGAFASAATSVPIIYAMFGNVFVNLNGYAVIAAIGALAMAVTALPRRKPV
ncbi:MAG: hypothetical protein P0Y65_13025 [Candidatus Devosia phytovorans]|uniref:Uncharacterized protein n=1 Tax=Candidatus Devosia phytovorans TaxID=3121372 RepID=A0AAJ5VTM6_9HYPH|nr:hypothetical protein [Devosia sp.]WEK03124.1 MAG: hypothetical protein P0Y65_13025 [Devosia sp.]